MGEADGEKGGEFETGREREELTDPKKPDTWQNNRLELLVQISSCKDGRSMEIFRLGMTASVSALVARARQLGGNRAGDAAAAPLKTIARCAHAQ